MANGSTAGERAGIGETEAQRGGGFGSFGGETRGSTAAQRRGSAGRTDVGRLSGGAGDEESALGRALKRIGAKIETAFGKVTSPTGLGALAGAIFGPSIGLSPAAGAKGGAFVGGLFEDEEEKGPAEPTAAAPQQLTRSAPGVTPESISAQRQFQDQRALLGGGDGRQVAAAPPVSRISGIQPQVPVVDPRLQQQQFLAGGVLPTVDISAFPGALGRA